MARVVKPLTAVQVKNAKPKEKTYRLFDGGGLYLEVTAKGSKLWRMKVTGDGGKENRLSFGIYPDVSLEQARERRDETRKLRAAGIDPVANRKAKKEAKSDVDTNTFALVAREWIERRKDELSANTYKNLMGRLGRDVLPYIGAKPVASITAMDILDVCRRLEGQNKIDTAHRIRTVCSQIMRYAVVTGRASHDPTPTLQGALKPKKVTHRAAIVEPEQVGELLRTMDAYKGSFEVLCALKIAPYVFVRPGELRQAKWAEIDLKKAEWRYMVGKTSTQHIVPLAKQVITILRELYPLTGHSAYVFPSPRTSERPMSDNAVLSAFRRMGIPKDEMSGHGFRALARTLLDEVLREPIVYIEHQLAHSVKDPLGRAYNRTAHLEERKRMMQRWADYLDDLKAGAKVIPFSDKAA
jgi:integrase